MPTTKKKYPYHTLRDEDVCSPKNVEEYSFIYTIAENLGMPITPYAGKSDDYEEFPKIGMSLSGNLCGWNSSSNMSVISFISCMLGQPRDKKPNITETLNYIRDFKKRHKIK